LSENSNEEKLSFKEQILRDLERLKKEANEVEQTDDLFSTLAKSSENMPDYMANFYYFCTTIKTACCSPFRLHLMTGKQGLKT